VTATLLILLKVAVAGIILAIGMDSTLKDATYLWHRPSLLLRSVLAMYVLVPLTALALVKVLRLAPGVEIGLLVLAVSAGAPLLPRKLMKIGTVLISSAWWRPQACWRSSWFPPGSLSSVRSSTIRFRSRFRHGEQDDTAVQSMDLFG
jgi:hypothetical protein